MKAIPTALLVLAACCIGSAQVPSPALPATIIRLEPPVYPPIAKAARVSGEVHLSVALSSDGTPSAVRLESGPPMLRDAATASAEHSRFQPVAGNPPEQPYKVIYRFQLDAAKDCNATSDPSYPRVKSDQNTITITGQAIAICDPAADQVRVRSVKCLFLWKCSLR